MVKLVLCKIKPFLAVMGENLLSPRAKFIRNSCSQPREKRSFMSFQQVIYLHDGLFQETVQMKMSVCRNCQNQHNLI